MAGESLVRDRIVVDPNAGALEPSAYERGLNGLRASRPKDFRTPGAERLNQPQDTMAAPSNSDGQGTQT